MIAEGCQLASPEGLHLFQPAPKFVEWFLAQAIDPHSRVFFHALLLDQSAAPQHSQMPAQGRRRQREGGGNFSRAPWLLLKKVNYRPALTVSQCRKSSVEFRFWHSYSPGAFRTRSVNHQR